MRNGTASRLDTQSDGTEVTSSFSRERRPEMQQKALCETKIETDKVSSESNEEDVQYWNLN